MKKIIIGFIIFAVLLGGAVNYLWSNLDSIVKAAIEKYGTAATQTDVRLSSVKISVTSGEGTLTGLSVANPKGFSSAKAFETGAISITVDTGSITSEPVVIREINIERPQVTYEVTPSGSNNLQAIEHNAMRYANASSDGSDGEDKNVATHSKKGKNGGEGRKIIINDLYIRSGQIQITSSLLQGRKLSAPLPTIHLTNIGKSDGGATPAEVAQQVIDSIVSSAANVATKELAKQLPGLVNVPAGGNVGNALKGLLNR